MQPENITLFYRQERSDKVYKAFLEQKEGLFVVNFAYGRRGSTLKTGTKTQSPVPYEKAKKIYDKLVLSKAAKGYVPDEDNSDYVVDTEQRKTGIHCQLLNPIDDITLEKLLSDDKWCAQEKMDGKRLLISKSEETTAINRKGLSVGAPKSMIEAVEAINATFIIDGEAIGDTLYVFDLLALNGIDIKNKTYLERYDLLKGLDFSDAVKIVPIAHTTTEKKNLFEKLNKAGAEGIVLKKINSTYQAGRPNSGGDQRKYKFYETASVLVSKVNDKRSVGMSLLDVNGNEVFVGNVTISPNKEIPKEGEIIEVRYLYAYKGGSIYQPTFLMLRNDLDQNDCNISQLKFKKEG